MTALSPGSMARIMARRCPPQLGHETMTGLEALGLASFVLSDCKPYHCTSSLRSRWPMGIDGADRQWRRSSSRANTRLACATVKSRPPRP